MLEDGRHNLWITTHRDSSFGLEHWERGNSHVDDSSPFLPQAARERGVTALAEVPDDQLWIGLGRPGGLYRQRKGQFEEVAGAPAGSVQALYRDGSNRLWIASAEAGLGRIDNPAAERLTVRRYDRAHGLSSNEVWCLAEDRYGRVYAGTAKGVDQIDPRTDRIIHYSSADGLTQGDIRAALSDRGGNLWFLSKRGLRASSPWPTSGSSRFRPELRPSGSRGRSIPYPNSGRSMFRLSNHHGIETRSRSTSRRLISRRRSNSAISSGFWELPGTGVKLHPIPSSISRTLRLGTIDFWCGP